MSSYPEPVRLDIHKNAKRYTSAERDAAFLVYMGAGRQNMSATARIVGVPRQTLHVWASEGQWIERISDSDNQSGSAAVHGAEVARAMFPHLVELASDRGLRILADDKGNQNAQVKLILEIWGMHGWVAPKQSMSVIQHLTDQADKTVISMKDLANLDPDQLAAWTGIDHDATADADADDTDADTTTQP